MVGAANLQSNSREKYRKNHIIYAAPIGIRIEFTSMISHVKSCTETHQFRKFLFTSEFTSENKAASLREF